MVLNMSNLVLQKFADLIEQQRDSLLASWRTKVREMPCAKVLDVPTLNDHIPRLLDELVLALRTDSNETIVHAIIGNSSPTHGMQRVEDDYEIDEVVAEYNLLRGCLHDLAGENSLPLQGRPFHILNSVLDSAVAEAVKTFAVYKALEVQHRREDYLAFVAHDLRTPLSAIALSAEVLEVVLTRNGNQVPQIEKMLKTLGRNTQHLKLLVSNVLEENSHLEAETGMKLERRELDLWPLVESLIYDLTPIADTASTTLVNKVPDDYVVYADANLLRRIFQNLIANAINYTPLGEVVIGLEECKDPAFIKCFVRDNGKGIEPSRRESIFNKLETDEDNEEGLGLGLAIVKTFVEAHGGTVTLESELDVGSVFSFTLHRISHAHTNNSKPAI